MAVFIKGTQGPLSLGLTTVHAEHYNRKMVNVCVCGIGDFQICILYGSSFLNIRGMVDAAGILFFHIHPLSYFAKHPPPPSSYNILFFSFLYSHTIPPTLFFYSTSCLGGWDRTPGQLTLAVRRSNHSARSYLHSTRAHTH